MTILISESEMLSRFLDSLKRAASRAQEFAEAPSIEKPKLFLDFIESVKVAAGSAHQLAHTQMNPKWLDVRDFLEQVIEAGKELPTLGDQTILWIKIKMSLLTLMENGEKLALAKSMPRAEVLSRLDVREKAARIESQNV